LTDSNERRRWELVAKAQRLAQRQEREGLRAVLSRTSEWPEDEWVLRWAAMVCRIIEARDLSGLFWERVLRIVDDPEARCALAKAALEDGSVGTAEEHVAALLRLKPDHAEGWLMQAVISMQRQEFEGAEKQFEHAFRLGADAKRSQLGMGMAVVGHNQPEKAWHICRHLSAEYPDDQEVLHWLLRVGVSLERWEPLSDDLERYIVRNPGDLSARFAYAGTLLRLGRTEAARKEYDTIRVLNPGFEGLEDLAKSLSAAGSLPLVV
jgi:Flp pilus assembly protein TadD